jgi:hypothetical protein
MQTKAYPKVCFQPIILSRLLFGHNSLVFISKVNADSRDPGGDNEEEQEELGKGTHTS